LKTKKKHNKTIGKQLLVASASVTAFSLLPSPHTLYRSLRALAVNLIFLWAPKRKTKKMRRANRKTQQQSRHK